jgi:hypothetical protein
MTKLSILLDLSEKMARIHLMILIRMYVNYPTDGLDLNRVYLWEIYFFEQIYER